MKPKIIITEEEKRNILNLYKTILINEGFDLQSFAHNNKIEFQSSRESITGGGDTAKYIGNKGQLDLNYDGNTLDITVKPLGIQVLNQLKMIKILGKLPQTGLELNWKIDSNTADTKSTDLENQLVELIQQLT